MSERPQAPTAAELLDVTVGGSDTLAQGRGIEHDAATAYGDHLSTRTNGQLLEHDDASAFVEGGYVNAPKSAPLEHDDASTLVEGGYVNAFHTAAQTAAKVDKPE